MSAGLAERAVAGVQTPRVAVMPVGDMDFTLGDRCVDWARDVLGLHLDEWECLVLRMLLARRADGRWACPVFGLLVSRRNGKSLVLLVRCLFGLLELGERDAVFTAHLGSTIRATFRLARRVLRNAPGPLPVYQEYGSDGRERVEFVGDRALWFSTRTKAGGRGTGADTLVIDEAQEADDAEMEALSPILGDRSMSGNIQLVYSGSAGDFESVVFGRVRRQALAGGSARLGWAEWSIDDEAYFAADPEARAEIACSPGSMAVANPSMGILRPDGSGGISEEWLRGQVDILSPPGFAREHGGVGTWPKDEGHDWVIPRLVWSAQGRPDLAVPAGTLVLGLSASWGDRSVAVAVAGSLPDGTCHGWLERMDRGTSWVVADVVRLVKANTVAAVLLDAGGPAKPLAAPLEQALAATGVPLVQLSGRDVAAACGGLSDAVTADPPGFSHRAQAEVDAGLAGTGKKNLGDGLWVFDRTHSESDIAPLEALAIARHGWVVYGADAASVYESRGIVELG